MALLVKISELPLADALTGEERLEVVQNGDNKQITTADLFGKSAYQVALDGGFAGTQTQWLLSLKGATGLGKSAYQLAVEGGYGGTETAWLLSLKGDNGANGASGADGENGASAYDLAIAGGFVGTQSQWLISIRGEQGPQGLAGNDGQDGDTGLDGADGASAYQLAVAGGFVGTQAQWLLTLKGADGQDGANGTNGLKGDTGDIGPEGPSGSPRLVIIPFITNYQPVLADANACLYHPPTDLPARTVTIPSNAAVPYLVGTMLTIDNDIAAGIVTIAITDDTMVLVGDSGTLGTRTLASGGQATAVKVTATRWRISGVGLT